jgi:hypothetical protein
MSREIIKEFQGKINRIDTDKVWVSMVDVDNNLEVYDASVHKFVFDGKDIQEGNRFIYRIIKENDRHFSEVEIVKPRQITPEEWQKMLNESAAVCLTDADIARHKGEPE